MGIDIHNDGRVTFNDAHEHNLNTSIDKNPTVKVIKGLKIQSIFRRLQTNGDTRDGNPFIHALKNKSGYVIDRRALTAFRANFRGILQTAITSVEADVIIPMPSGHWVASYLATCVSRKWHGNAPVVLAFRKRTIAEMLSGPRIPDEELGSKIKLYRNQIRAWEQMPSGSFVAMKALQKSIRPFFSPLCLLDPQFNFSGQRVLLVDDLLASGSTLKSAQSILESGNCASVSALCLLSGL